MVFVIKLILTFFCFFYLSIDKPDHLKPADYQNLYSMESGKNLFHITCELGINCLISVVWKLAEKIFQENRKEYFLKKCTSPFYPDHDAIFYVFRRISYDKAKTKLENYLTINELRGKNGKNVSEIINLNVIENFRLSTIYLIFEIMKKLRISDDELIEILSTNHDYIAKFPELSLNLNLYILSDFISTDSKIVDNILVNIYNASGKLIYHSHNNEKTKSTLEFLEEKLSNNNLKKIISNIFAIFIQSYNKNYYDDYRFYSKALVLYLKLKSVFENDLETLNDYFKTFPKFFDFVNEKNYNCDALNGCLKTIFKLFDEDHLTMILLNEANCMNIIAKVIVIFINDFHVHDRIKLLLNLLESRYSEKEKLYFIVDQSHMLEVSTLSANNFPLIYEFCEKHFGKLKIEALLFPPGKRAKISLDHMNVLNTIMNLFIESFDTDKWKIFFFKTYENDKTIIHELMRNNKFTENALKLIDTAKDKLGDDFEKLLNLKDANSNSIASLKDQ